MMMLGDADDDAPCWFRHVDERCRVRSLVHTTDHNNFLHFLSQKNHKVYHNQGSEQMLLLL